MKKRLGLVLLILVVLSLPVSAKELSGVKLDDSVTIEGTDLKLKGMGLRNKKVFLFNVNVYVAGLYVKDLTKDAQAILAADEPRRIVMEFVYKHVERGKIAGAWRDGFKAQGVTGEKVDQLCNWLPEGFRKGEQIVITYLPGKGIQVAMKGEEKGTIPGKDFADAMFGIFIGAKPVQGGLKNGMLGK